MEAWDGGWGACAGGPHHHMSGDRMLLQLSIGKVRGKNSREKKRAIFHERESRQCSGGWPVAGFGFARVGGSVLEQRQILTLRR